MTFNLWNKAYYQLNVKYYNSPLSRWRTRHAVSLLFLRSYNFQSTNKSRISLGGFGTRPYRIFVLGMRPPYHQARDPIHLTTPNPAPIFANALNATSRSSIVRAADNCVRMRAWPMGTTGYEKPMAYTPSS